MSDTDPRPPNEARRMKGMAIGVVLIVFGLLGALHVWYRDYTGDPVMFGERDFDVGSAIFFIVLGVGILVWCWLRLSAGGDDDRNDPSR